MIASIFAALSLLGLFGGDATTAQQFTFTTPGAPVLQVTTTNGSIRVSSGGSRVEITATKKADSVSELDQLKVQTSRNGSNIVVRGVFPRNCSGCAISFEVKVPAGTKVSLTSTNGGVDATGLSADASLASTNGVVNASFAGTAAVRSITMSSINGGVTVSLPAGAKIGRVHAAATVGHISSDWTLQIDHANIVGSNVEQTLVPGGIILDLTTITGVITLRKN